MSLRYDLPRTATKDIYRKKRHLKECQVLFEVHLRQMPIRKEKKAI